MKKERIIEELLMTLMLAACDDKDQTKLGDSIELEAKLSEGV